MMTTAHEVDHKVFRLFVNGFVFSVDTKKTAETEKNERRIARLQPGEASESNLNAQINKHQVRAAALLESSHAVRVGIPFKGRHKRTKPRHSCIL